MSFKWLFIAISNVQIRLIQGYNKLMITTRRFSHSILTGRADVQQRTIYAIENARDWKISNKGRSNSIANAHDCTGLMNNVRKRPIQVHNKHTVTHRGTREHTGKTNNVWESPSRTPNKHTNGSLGQILIIKIVIKF